MGWFFVAEDFFNGDVFLTFAFFLAIPNVGAKTTIKDLRLKNYQRFISKIYD
jgi:hypothetical protein